LIKECGERSFGRKEVVENEEAQKQLWEYSEKMVQEAEKRGKEYRIEMKRKGEEAKEEQEAEEEVKGYKEKNGKKEGSRRSRKAG